jgi:hypothetical protein
MPVFWNFQRIFYRWKRAYERLGEKTLINSKPYPENIEIRVSQPIEDKMFHLRKSHHFAAEKIFWYLARYHAIKGSSGGVQGVLRRAGLNRLHQNMKGWAWKKSFHLHEK